MSVEKRLRSCSAVWVLGAMVFALGGCSGEIGADDDDDTPASCTGEGCPVMDTGSAMGEPAGSGSLASAGMGGNVAPGSAGIGAAGNAAAGSGVAGTGSAGSDQAGSGGSSSPDDLDGGVDAGPDAGDDAGFDAGPDLPDAEIEDAGDGSTAEPDSGDPEPDASVDPCPEGDACDDGEFCTIDDRCHDGACSGVARVCDDGRNCTVDSCSEGSNSCVSDTSACDCQSDDDCDDQNECTDDACQNLECVHESNSAGCDDGNACTSGDRCAGGSCQPGDDLVCDDHAGDPCFADRCDPELGCISEYTTATCDDGRSCTTNDRCAQGVCTGNDDGCDGPTDLPDHQEPCPTFALGTMQFLDNDVEILGLGSAQAHGPLIFYWHGTGSSPLEAQFVGLGTSVIDDIESDGGIVVAMIGGQGSGQNTSGTAVWHDSDMVVADEIVACAIERGIDPKRIHSLGMSAGGLHTTFFSYMRSNYLASVVVYSGGLLPFSSPTNADPDNKFAAMIVHGGADDVVGGFSFQTGSEDYYEDLTGDDHFAFLCNHDGGHTIPAGIGGDAWQFFQDHPYGTQPSPYAGELPASFPDYCSLQP